MRSKSLFTSLIIVFVIFLMGGAVLYRAYLRYQRIQKAKVVAKAADVKVTILEGWTDAEIAQAMEKQQLTTADNFKAALNKFDLSAYPVINDSKPKANGFEGFLFPDTYLFAEKSTPEDLISRILKNFTSRINTLGLSDGQKLYAIPGYENIKLAGNKNPGLNLYQVLTLASIVEKESGGKGLSASQVDSQRAIIAGIFLNRLAINQALESDATVNYVTGKNDPGVSTKDLTTNSPYNTYKYPGLPPGPICNPSLASIKAVMTPQKTDYFYFLHKQPSGEVLYSKTFDEHVRKKQ
jgi:UPF0755 protein